MVAVEVLSSGAASVGAVNAARQTSKSDLIKKSVPLCSVLPRPGLLTKHVGINAAETQAHSHRQACQATSSNEHINRSHSVLTGEE
jgi:hypothetical protein